MPEPLDIAGVAYALHRWPLRHGDPLRAWDTADLYLHQELGEADPGRLLSVGDSFGALAIPLHERAPTLWSDSHLTRLALNHNLAANDLAPGAVTFVPADTEPDGAFDTVLARFPKSLAFWEDTLLRLRAHLAPGARVLAGGMIKHTPRRAFELMLQDRHSFDPILLGAFIISSVDNVLRPMLIAGRSQLNGFVVIIGVFGGIAAFGFLGIVLGPLLAAITMGALKAYRNSLVEAA